MRFKNLFKKRGHMYFMISHLLMMLIPFLIGIFAYIGIENMTRNQALGLNKALNEQIANDVDQNILEFDNLSNTILSNTRVKKYSNFTEKTGTTIYELFDMRKDLINLNLSTSTLTDYFLFFPNSDTIMTKSSSFTPELYYTICSIKNADFDHFTSQILRKNHHGEFLHYTMISKEKAGKEYLLYAKSTPDYYKNSVVVNFFALLDVSSFTRILNSYMDISTGSMMAIVYNGEILYRSKSGISDEELFNAADKYKDDVICVHDEHIVTTKKSEMIDGWSYIMLTPMSHVMKTVRKIRNTTLVLIFAYLSLSLVVSYLLSKKNYAPIKSLFLAMKKYGMEIIKQEYEDYDHNDYISGLKRVETDLIKIFTSNKAVTERLSDLLPIAKNNILVSLLKGTFKVKGNYTDLLDSYGLDLNQNYFTVILIGIIENNVHESLSVVVNMAINEIRDTLCMEDSPNYCVEIENFKYAVLINTTNLKSTDDIITYIAETYIDLLKTKYKMDSYACIGNTVAGIDNIQTSMEEALKASYYHVLIPDVKIIEYKKLRKTGDIVFYKEDIEVKFKNCLLLGETDKSAKMIDNVLKKNFENLSIDPQIMQCIVSQIFMMALNISNSIGYDLYQELIEGKTELKFLEPGTPMVEIRRAFHDIVHKIGQYIKENRKDRLDILKDNIIKIIDGNISDSNLTQVFIADRLNMSAPYLSSIFKEIFGINMSDYIGKKRSDRVAELLKSSDLNLDKIAMKVGFIDSPALIRVFKKHYGITPGEYRKTKKILRNHRTS